MNIFKYFNKKIDRSLIEIRVARLVSFMFKEDPLVESFSKTSSAVKNKKEIHIQAIKVIDKSSKELNAKEIHDTIKFYGLLNCSLDYNKLQRALYYLVKKGSIKYGKKRGTFKKIKKD